MSACTSKSSSGQACTWTAGHVPAIHHARRDDGSSEYWWDFPVGSFNTADTENEACAQICDAMAEELKHASHKDGLGMGWQEGEQVCSALAARIRQRRGN